MSQDKNFDQAFKERINQMEFEFKDSYWDEMEALLDNKKKKRGALFWWIGSFSVASLLLAGTLFFLKQEPKENALKDKLKNESYTQKTEINSGGNLKSEQTFDQVAEQANNNKNSISTTQSSSKERIEHNEDYNNSPLTKDSKSEKRNQQTFKSDSETTNSESTIQDKENIVDVVSKNTNHDIALTQNTDEPLENSNSTAVLKSELFQKLPMQAVQLELDSKGLQMQQLSDEPSIIKNTWDSHVGILAGGNFGQSLKTADGVVGGVGSHWGLRFYFAHKKGLQLNTGLSFGVNSINGLKFEEHRKVFGFTQYDLVNIIHYQSMFTAHIPLYIGYESGKFSVAGGLRMNYIMNTKGRVYTWDGSIYDQNIWGYANGIKYFNMACGIESTYRFARRWDAGLSFDLDLSSRSEENNNLISPEARLWQAGVFVKFRLN